MVKARDLRSDDLRHLAAIAETGRLTTAARSMGVDHSTVSRRLHALEDALGIRIISRSDDGWMLTDAGRDLLEHAREVQRSVESVAQYASGVEPGSVSGMVRITAAEGFGTVFVVPAVGRVQREHHDLSVELVTGSRELGLQANSFDIAITPGRRPATRLHLERLCEYDSDFYGSDDYFARHGNPATLADLQDHRLVYFIDALQKIRELDLAEVVETADLAFSSTSIFAQLAAVRGGTGIGLLSKFMAGTVDGIRPVDATVRLPRVPVSMVMRREAIHRPAIAAIREALHREVLDRRDELVWMPNDRGTTGTSVSG
jgi:DNA-binding transcriptional LysR family regulator